MRLTPCLLLLALASLPTVLPAEDSLESRIQATDLSNADQVLALAQWCHEHQLQVRYHKYLHEVLRLDPDNPQAREDLGYVRVGDRWVFKAYAPAGAGGASGAAEPPPAPAAPGPTATQISWLDAIPADPQPANAFITKYVARLPTVANDSQEMDVSVATCIDPKNWPSALPRLCAALGKPDFTDLYGAAMMVLELNKQGRIAQARPLLGPMVKALPHVTDPEDIEAFCWAAAALKDRRVVPCLIELIEKGPADITQAAGQAVSTLAHQPGTMDAAQAHAWWNENWNRSENDALRAQLASSDDAVAIEAARALYDVRDRTIIPVAIRCLKNTEPTVRRQAIDLIARATGDDWGFDPLGPDESRAKVITHLEQWWKESGDTFQFRVPLPTASSSSATDDPSAAQVSNLDRPEGTLANDAENNLRHRGLAAVPALIQGLSSASVITRRKCSELLTTITGATIAFDARAGEDDRAHGVAAWQAWWQAHKPASPAPNAGGGADAATGGGATAPAPTPHPAPTPMPGL